MTATSPLTIRHMIVHKLDHRSRSAPELATDLTPTDPKAVKFITDHISTNRVHHRAREANFIERPTNHLAQATETIFDRITDAAIFITQSQEIAQHLFATMRTRQRISPGDLVVCLFDDGSAPTVPALALLKLDPQSGFRGVPKTIGSQTRVVLEEVADVLPATELQKCAFIVSPSQRTAVGHDLVVLDQQTGRFGTARPVASFFLDRFLRCEVDFNAADLTFRVVQETVAWANAQSGWDGATRWRLTDRIHQAIANERVNVVAVADEVIPTVTERDAYLDYLRSKRIRQFIFRPDPETRDRLRAFYTFEGDEGLQLRVPPEAFERGIVNQVQNPNDGSWTITIHTNTWNPMQASLRSVPSKQDAR